MKTSKTKPFVMGISGGSGSGKSTIIQGLVDHLGMEKVAVLHHDTYYFHRPDLTYEERTKINYDHPDSLETSLLVEHMDQLISGNSANIPQYDYAQHLRESEYIQVDTRPILILDGILVLNDEVLRERMDLKVYVDVPDDLRLIRRMNRDLQERGRSVESVIDQYLTSVRPMHEKFVEPSKKYADILIPGGGHNKQAGRLLLALLQTLPAG